MLYDDSTYMTNLANANAFLAPYLRGDSMFGLYDPILYASDFWNLRKDLV